MEIIIQLLLPWGISALGVSEHVGPQQLGSVQAQDRMSAWWTGQGNMLQHIQTGPAPTMLQSRQDFQTPFAAPMQQHRLPMGTMPPPGISVASKSESVIAPHASMLQAFLPPTLRQGGGVAPNGGVPPGGSVAEDTTELEDGLLNLAGLLRAENEKLKTQNFELQGFLDAATTVTEDPAGTTTKPKRKSLPMPQKPGYMPTVNVTVAYPYHKQVETEAAEDRKWAFAHYIISSVCVFEALSLCFIVYKYYIPDEDDNEPDDDVIKEKEGLVDVPDNWCEWCFFCTCHTFYACKWCLCCCDIVVYIGLWILFHIFVAVLWFMLWSGSLDDILVELEMYIFIGAFGIAIVGMILLAIVLKIRKMFGGTFSAVRDKFYEVVVNPIQQTSEGIDDILDWLGLSEDSDSEEAIAKRKEKEQKRVRKPAKKKSWFG